MKIGKYLIMIGVISTIVNRKNYIIVLLSIELMWLAISYILIKMSFKMDDFFGILFCFFLFTFAAAESALGLALLLLNSSVRD